MTQPAFSRRIRALEAWIGSELFDRSGQPATLTETGAWFVGIAQEMLARAERIPTDAKVVFDAHASALRIASTHALSLTFLPQWLRGMEEKLSNSPMSLVSDVLPRCEALLTKGHVQFVLCHSHPAVSTMLTEQSYPFRLIGADRLIPVTIAGKNGKPKHSVNASKSTVSLLSYSPESGIARILEAVRGAEIEALSLKSVVRAQSASVLRSMVLEGRGMAWLPNSIIAEDLARGEMVYAADARWIIDLDISLFRDKSALSTAGEDFWANVRTRKKTHAL